MGIDSPVAFVVLLTLARCGLWSRNDSCRFISVGMDNDEQSAGLRLPEGQIGASSSEWSGSKNVTARGFTNTVAASSEETPCGSRFTAALSGAHSKRTVSKVAQSVKSPRC